MCMIFRVIIKVLMLMIFKIFINIEDKTLNATETSIDDK